jgi:predicted nuclease with TOPRIM domain
MFQFKVTIFIVAANLNSLSSGNEGVSQTSLTRVSKLSHGRVSETKLFKDLNIETSMREEFKQAIISSFQNIKQDIELNNERINKLEQENKELKLKVKELTKEVDDLNNKDPLKKEIINKLNRNKKELIKTKILELVDLERYSIPEIKEILVDRDKYCSKATFYRYLEEVKGLINEVSIGSKILTVRNK